jgi:FkbM family methyltransferase
MLAKLGAVDKGWSVMANLILYGAGTIGRAVAKKLIANGNLPKCFADNDREKWGTEIEGIVVQGPLTSQAMFPNAQWMPTVQRESARKSILEDMNEMGVDSIPFSLYDYISPHREIPPDEAISTIMCLMEDVASAREWIDQIKFRKNLSHTQIPASYPWDIYFESFYTRLDNERFIDCGAADGDTVREFRARWNNYSQITAFEPDPRNYRGLSVSVFGDQRISTVPAAVSDKTGVATFTATGDQSAHIGGDYVVNTYRMDHVLVNPTLIKMDIEGCELDALWGAREMIRKHSPVLAICAYHTGDHLWQIPLLIHALNPTYRLYLRRYLEQTWDLVWYAVPPERIKR